MGFVNVPLPTPASYRRPWLTVSKEHRGPIATLSPIVIDEDGAANLTSELMKVLEPIVMLWQPPIGLTITGAHIFDLDLIFMPARRSTK
jgi:hypothetical protein